MHQTIQPTNQTEPTIQADQPEVKMVRMNVWKGQQQGSELSIDWLTGWLTDWPRQWVTDLRTDLGNESLTH